MTILLNGKPHTSDPGAETVSVREFLDRLEIGEQPVLVEVNGEAILVREFDDRFIRDGDTVEVIRMVAGG